MPNTHGLSTEEWNEKATSFFNDLTSKYLPGVSVNIVVFHCDGTSLRVLLMRFADTGSFMLPGGYVGIEEDLDDAAERCFREWTGTGNPVLEQFFTSGKVKRSSEELQKRFFTDGLPDTFSHWFDQRKISVCYYTLAENTGINPSALEGYISEYRWIDVAGLPDLLFDHKLIIEKAIQELQADLDKKITEVRLLPDEFTMGELQGLYEAVFQRCFTRTNFQRRMLSLDILERLGKKFGGGAHKAPYLYRVKSVPKASLRE